MTTADFLRAIIDRPADDSVRLAYADWCEEHGQGERAEFVRVQIDLARMAKAPYGAGPAVEDFKHRRDTLRRREGELLHYNGRVFEWIGNWHHAAMPDVPAVHHNTDGRRIRFTHAMNRSEWLFSIRRGFVAEIACSWDHWCEHAAAIRAATPLERVTLTSWPAITFSPDRREYRTKKFHPGLMSGRFPEIVQLALAHDYPGLEFTLPAFDVQFDNYAPGGYVLAE